MCLKKYFKIRLLSAVKPNLLSQCTREESLFQTFVYLNKYDYVYYLKRNLKKQLLYLFNQILNILAHGKFGTSYIFSLDN